MDVAREIPMRYLDSDMESGFRDPGEIPAAVILKEGTQESDLSGLFGSIRNALAQKGFQVRTVCDGDFTGENAASACEAAVSEALVAVVVLDPSNPAMMCHFAVLKGKGKVVIPVLDKKDRENSRAGLVLLSDLLSTGALEVDGEAPPDSPEYPGSQVQKALDRQIPQLAKAYWDQIVAPFSGHPSEYPQDWPVRVCQGLEYLMEKKSYTIWDLERLAEDMGAMEKAFGPEAVYGIYRIMARLHEKFDGDHLSKGNRAKDLYQKILSSEISDKRKAPVYKILGDFYLRLTWHEKEKECGIRAVQAYHAALEQTEDRAERAMIIANMGLVYLSLAEVEDAHGNAQKAVETFEEALEIFSPGEFFVEHARVGEMIEIAKARLLVPDSEYEEPVDEAPGESVLPARLPGQNEAIEGSRPGKTAVPQAGGDQLIEAHRRVLDIFTLREFPLEYSFHCEKIADEYLRLADQRDRGSHLMKSIEALNEALRAYPEDATSEKYAELQKKLGRTYRLLAAEENAVENYKRALEACQSALRFYTPENYPVDYMILQNEMGVLFGLLVETQGGPENFERADKAFQKALKVFSGTKEYKDFIQSIEGNRRQLLASWKTIYH